MALAPVTYRVRMADLNAHLFQVSMSIAQPSAKQRVQLPTWIPGSYLIREFSRNLQGLTARQGRRNIPLQQLDKCSWQIDCQTATALVLSYEVYAFDPSVRSAWLDSQRGFFNGTSLLLMASGHETTPHVLELIACDAKPSWHAATGLAGGQVDSQGFGSYRAADYAQLVDAPVEIGDHWTGSFEAGGIRHRFVVAGAPPGFDGRQLLIDTQKICETQIRFWHGGQQGEGLNEAPHQDYLFMLNAVDEGYGGLEHHNSTALICARRDLPRVGGAKPSGHDGYQTLLGLISHEYFHTWNVKRLRPVEFTRYDFTQENYSKLLWFFEGFTSYYDELLLRRTGLIDDAAYLGLLAKTINQVHQTPGRKVQSLSQASFDAWVKYYRQDENTPNATVSYYGTGALVALCLDLSLRQERTTTLDAVMRALWARGKGGPMTEEDLAEVLSQLAGRSYSGELLKWVHGTSDLPVARLLSNQGVTVHEEDAPFAQRLGIRVSNSGPLKIKAVLRGSAAEQAGFAAGDEWLAIEVGRGRTASMWRINRLDDLLVYLGKRRHLQAWVSRDMRMHRLNLVMPRAASTVRLEISDRQRASQWLSDR